jgi:hypothetical protein
LKLEDDLDYFKFTVPATLPHHGVIKFNLTDFAGSPQIEILDVTEQGYGYSDYSTRDGANLVGWITVRPGRTYYAIVKERFDDIVTTPYSLKLEYMPVVDVDEPNNRLTEATPLELDSVHSAFLFAGEPVDDEDIADYYEIELAEPETLTVSITTSPTNANMAFEIISESGTSVFSGYTTVDGANVIKTSTKALAAGKYYVVLTNRFSLDNSKGGKGEEVADHVLRTYTLKITGTPETPTDP